MNCTSSVSLEVFQGFARGLAHVAFLPNITLLAINMKATWRASFHKSRQANQLNNSGITEEVVRFATFINFLLNYALKLVEVLEFLL